MDFWNSWDGPRPAVLSIRMPPGDDWENRGENRPGGRTPASTRVEKKIYVVYQKPGLSLEEQRKNIAKAKEVSPAELAKIEAAQAQRVPSIAGSSASSSPPNEFIDGDLAKEALKAGKDEKEVAELLQQMKVDATYQAGRFKDKWRAYLQQRQRRLPKSPSEIFHTHPLPVDQSQGLIGVVEKVKNGATITQDSMAFSFLCVLYCADQ